MPESLSPSRNPRADEAVSCPPTRGHRHIFLPLLGAVLAVFVLTVADVRQNFALLPDSIASLFAVSCAAAILWIWRLGSLRTRLVRNVVLVLLTGVGIAQGIRLFGYGGQLKRSTAEWEAQQASLVERIAESTASRFTELTRRARATAERLARSQAIAVAVEGSDAHDYITAAFDELEETPLPRAHSDGNPGVTLYDAWRRPLAWAGENISLKPFIEQRQTTPDSELLIFQQGVLTYLVAVEPLVSRLGFISVEIPLSAERHLDNRYLEDYDAVSTWAQRNFDTEYITFEDDGGELSRLFQERGARFWGGAEEAPRLFVGLLTEEQQLLGVSSVASETTSTARLEARQKFKQAAGVALSLSAALAFLLLVWNLTSDGTSLREVAVLLSGLWALRLCLFFTEVPLGLAADLDNPAHYASSLFFMLARSPIDFLLTMVSLAITSLLVARLFITYESRAHRNAPAKRKLIPTLLRRTLGAAVVLFLLLAADIALLDTWLNSSVSLSTIQPFPMEPSTLAVQVGLICLFATVALSALVALSFAEGRHETGYRDVLGVVGVDLAVLALAYQATVQTSFAEHIPLCAVPLISFHLVVLVGKRVTRAVTSDRLLLRFGTALLLLLLSVITFYPAIAHFEDVSIRNFVETTVAPIILQHGTSELYVLTETARAIEQMEQEGRLGDLARKDLAYRIWVETDLAVSFLSSSVEIIDSSRQVAARFALNFPSSGGMAYQEVATREWMLDRETLPNAPNHPGIYLVRRSIDGPDGLPWEIQVRLAADWRNLPFISTQNPYVYLFRTAGVDTPLPFPYRDLELFIVTADGTTAFESVERSHALDARILDDVSGEPTWVKHFYDEEVHWSYVFSGDSYTYVLSYPSKPLLAYTSELAGWALLTAALATFYLLLLLLLGALGSPFGAKPSELWAQMVASFYGKLYVAFVLIALVPIVSLAFFIRSIVIQQLERDVEQEGVARARVVERFVNDLVIYQRDGVEGRDDAAVTDAVLEWVGSLTDVDVDLFSGGELLATSKPELFGSGLLRTRAVPSTYRDIVLRQLSHSIHWESFGTFRYLVVSVPIALQPWREPGLLSLPLASRQREIDEKVSSLNQTVLLAALGFSLAAVALAYSLAKRIAGPINMLTDATHRVAGGDLDVSLATESRGEIGALFASFTQMTSDLKQQRQDLEETKKLEAWAEMARQVAHEIKNPLTPIQLSTEHMQRVFNDPDVDFEAVLKDCSETILQQVRALRQISMEFSTFASPEPLHKQTTDLAQLVRSTMEPYLMTPPKGIEVELEVAAPLPSVQIDQRLLKRTLLNLVENSLLALDGKGQVVVHVAPYGDNGNHGIEVRVADNGSGVEPQFRERIFEPYFSTRATGTGLGLAIARKVIEDHGGTIAMTSETGEGTEVSFRIPATDPD